MSKNSDVLDLIEDFDIKKVEDWLNDADYQFMGYMPTDEALMFVTETRRASISGVQRKFKIGYNRAARIIEQMEQQGVVSSQGHNGSREVLAPPPVK